MSFSKVWFCGRILAIAAAPISPKLLPVAPKTLISFDIELVVRFPQPP
ncbi:hypothetical protein H6G06_07870 [Anabaena sphaerica FACHB-251]|uniref:Uncharacterized protein n=1 Tax=Anabaena sphaerica FACHB-251 TaxID=2692883 RepID=A0A927A0N4_9NOST|nr:hypothetical protein [Anabaena sphaerica]MBD2293406.1 hypothetical protein [Anabaena sphaerica FACHB-251]